MPKGASKYDNMPDSLVSPPIHTVLHRFHYLTVHLYRVFILKMVSCAYFMVKTKPFVLKKFEIKPFVLIKYCL